MKRFFYPRLAAMGIAKNSRTYIPYLLTCAGMVMMYYIMLFLTRSSQVAAMSGGATLQTMVQLGADVFCVFAAVFLFYTNSFLVKRRKKEFGLYNILGMGKRNLARILLWECLFLAAISFAGGLGLGILLSKAAELAMAYVLEGTAVFGFSLDATAVVRTIQVFACIFLLILANMLRQIHISKPIELLHSEAEGEKPPKGNWVLALIGLALLAAAYYIAVAIEDPTEALFLFFLAVLMVILGTYLLFIAGSVVFCRVLQKRKSYYYKANHFISVSSMMYRMKRNGAGLASICILSTMVLVMISATVCLYVGKEASLRERHPRDVEVQMYSADPQYGEALKMLTGELAETAGVDRKGEVEYRYLSFVGYQQEDQVVFDISKVSGSSVADYNKIRQVFFFPLEDYNRLSGQQETLAEDEVLLYCYRNGKFEYPSVTVEGWGTKKIKNQVEKFVSNGQATMQIVPSYYFIVPDMAAVTEIEAAEQVILGENASQTITYYGFDTDAPAARQKELAKLLEERLPQWSEGLAETPGLNWDLLVTKRGDFYGMYGGLFVLGILLGSVFLVAAVLIMYYKQMTEGYEDQSRFEVMQKVGMTKREIRSSINSQMLTVFFLPLLMAGIHLAFAFPFVQKMLLLFGLQNVGLLAGTTGISFLVYAVFYVAVYLITSRSYFRIVSGGYGSGR